MREEKEVSIEESMEYWMNKDIEDIPLLIDNLKLYPELQKDCKKAEDILRNLLSKIKSCRIENLTSEELESIIHQLGTAMGLVYDGKYQDVDYAEWEGRNSRYRNLTSADEDYDCWQGADDIFLDLRDLQRIINDELIDKNIKMLSKFFKNDNDVLHNILNKTIDSYKSFKDIWDYNYGEGSGPVACGIKNCTDIFNILKEEMKYRKEVNDSIGRDGLDK